MTKLKPDIKPELNIHTMRDRHKAQKHLNRLVEVLDTPAAPKQADLDVVSYLKKTPLREVDV